MQPIYSISDPFCGSQFEAKTFSLPPGGGLQQIYCPLFNDFM